MNYGPSLMISLCFYSTIMNLKVKKLRVWIFFTRILRNPVFSCWLKIREWCKLTLFIHSAHCGVKWSPGHCDPSHMERRMTYKSYYKYRLPQAERSRKISVVHSYKWSMKRTKMSKSEIWDDLLGWSRHSEGHLWGFNNCPPQSMACQEMFLKAPRILDPWVSGYYVHFGRLCGKFQRDFLACNCTPKSKNHYHHPLSENRTAFGIKGSWLEVDFCGPPPNSKNLYLRAQMELRDVLGHF